MDASQFEAASANRSATPGYAGLDVSINAENEDSNAEAIDWDKVGRVYKPESGI